MWKIYYYILKCVRPVSLKSQVFSALSLLCSSFAHPDHFFLQLYLPDHILSTSFSLRSISLWWFVNQQILSVSLMCRFLKLCEYLQGSRDLYFSRVWCSNLNINWFWSSKDWLETKTTQFSPMRRFDNWFG